MAVHPFLKTRYKLRALASIDYQLAEDTYDHYKNGDEHRPNKTEIEAFLYVRNLIAKRFNRQELTLEEMLEKGYELNGKQIDPDE